MRERTLRSHFPRTHLLPHPKLQVFHCRAAKLFSFHAPQLSTAAKAMASERWLRKVGQLVDTGKGPAQAPKVASATKGKWKASMVAHGQLDRLSNARYLPLPETAFPRPGLTMVDDVIVQETIPHPKENEHVCFVPFLIHGLGFPAVTAIFEPEHQIAQKFGALFLCQKTRLCMTARIHATIM